MFHGKMVIYFITFGALLAFDILKTAKADIPGCHFLETVNLTGSQSFENGSYMYAGIGVPVNFTGTYDYITTEGEYTESMENHLRGCVCRLKPCIWICCRYKDWDPSNGKCTDGLMEELSEINPFLNVTLSNGSVVKKNLLKDFIVLRDRIRQFDAWVETGYTLFENRSLFLNISETINVRGYDCLHPNQFTAGSTKAFVVAYHMNFFYKPQPVRMEQNTVALWLSNVFCALTIAVYLCVKKLRNLHGKCFVCYLIMSFINSVRDVESVPLVLQFCALRGYFDYFLVMARFSWLLALSYQLWKGLRSVNRDESEYSFGAYNIFAWGTPAVLTGVTFLIDEIWGSDPSKVKWVPGMGWENCYLKTSFFSYHGYILYPIFIILLLNTILFIWTLISIIRVKLSLRQYSDQHERKQNLSSRMQKYYLFLRLAIVMDMQWSVTIISIYSDLNLLEEICEYCRTHFGIIIFVLFVLKRSTLKLIMESIRNRSD